MCMYTNKATIVNNTDLYYVQICFNISEILFYHSP
jgi:hypothetical protein